MKNLIVLSGKLPAFEGKYVPATGDKKSRMNWAINTQLSTKNANGYYDEILVNFTVWGYYADLLQQINVLPKDDPTRKKFMTITLTGKFALYIFSFGVIILGFSLATNSITLPVLGPSFIVAITIKSLF